MNHKKPLIIFGGLPGTGKTTISNGLAKKLHAVYIRIDTIETAIESSSLDIASAENAGYLVGFNIATENLKLGNIVIADSVNSIPITRQGWQNSAKEANVPFLEIEITCSDQAEHKKRIENRNVDKQSLTPIVLWEDVQNRAYHEWHSKVLTLDTSKLTTEECIEKIISCL